MAITGRGRGRRARAGRRGAAATALGTALALALAGCGGSGGGEDEGDGSAADDALGLDGADGGSAVGGAGTAGVAPGPDGTDAFFRPDQIRIVDAAGATTEIIDSYDDARGLIAVQERFVDGTPSEVRRYEYGADGRLLARIDTVGETDEVLRGARFFHGPGGELAGSEIVRPDGTLERRLTYEFDADGRVEAATLVALADAAGDPIEMVVERVGYAYAAGRLTSESVDENGDGSIERTRDYAYLPDGRLETITTNDAAAGSTAVETWRYETGTCSLAWANSLFAHFCVPTDAAAAGGA